MVLIAFVQVVWSLKWVLATVLGLTWLAGRLTGETS